MQASDKDLPSEAPAEERERKERRESRRLEKGRSQDYSVVPEKREEGPVTEAEKQRKEEEYQTRYRSDPNLARYPVQPPPEEQQMRMHARVSRARHERRHSDVSLPRTEAAALNFHKNRKISELLLHCRSHVASGHHLSTSTPIPGPGNRHSTLPL